MKLERTTKRGHDASVVHASVWSHEGTAYLPLGDIVAHDIPQIWEVLEDRGLVEERTGMQLATGGAP